MNMNPAAVARNRTARLVREATTPVYSTSTEGAQRNLIATAQDRLCGEDYCFVCNRCTDHWGEHTDAQILSAWSKRKWMH